MPLARKEWSLEEEEQLFLMRRDGHSYINIGSVLGRTANCIKMKYRSTRWKDKPFFDKAAEFREKAFQVRKGDLQEKLVKLGEAKLERYTVLSEIIADRVEDAVRSLPKAQPSQHRRSTKIKQKHESEEVGLLLSDLHIGHHHTLEETGGISEFNTDIFLDRVEVLKEAVVDIAELHANLYKLPTMHIFCMGDIVAGMNAVGSWSSTFINTDIMSQWSKGTKSLADMIYYWLGIFKEIHFYGVVGNHGRIAEKNIEKHIANWDMLTYKMLEQMFQDNPRVHFHVPQTWWLKAVIKNHRFLVVHGDDVRGSGSGVIKSFEGFIQRWSTVANFIPHYTIAGHFHNAGEYSVPNGRLLLNGSFVGGDVYCLKTIHTSSPPEQKIFGIHSKRGLTWSYNIDLRGKLAANA